MKKKFLTNKAGKVRELTTKDIKGMKNAREVLPSKLFAKLPNKRTKKAMAELEAGKGKRVKSIKSLKKDLNNKKA